MRLDTSGAHLRAWPRSRCHPQLHIIALIADFDPAKARAIWLGLSSDAVRRLDDLWRAAKPSPASPTSH